MRILIVGINYAPELAGIGKYTGEMAEWLADRGHEIRVVTAPPYYPAWRVWKGYSAWFYRRECLKGVKVYRCPLWVPGKASGIKRLIHLVSFAISSIPVLLTQVIWKPQVVINIAPAFFTAPAALLAARLSGAKAFLHIQDFEVDAAFALGLLKMTALQRLVGFLESWIMRRFDRVSTISHRMLENLWKKGVPESRSVLFPNWADTELIYTLQGPGSMRAELGIPSDTVVALYSGNMGQKHGLEILVEVAQKLKSHPKIRFVLCGEGVACSIAQSMAPDLHNVNYLPLQPVERLNDLLNLADIHLLPQRADAADLVMPSKLTGILASGKPVVATAHLGTEVDRVVRPCGLVVSPGDAVAFADALVWLAEHPEERQEFGRAGRDYAVKNMSKEVILSKFESCLLEFLRE